jgi:hypothetical protein
MAKKCTIKECMPPKASPYGTGKDWWLCFGFIIFCAFPSMSPRNPEGHSPRYRRRHPVPEAPPPPSKPPTQPTPGFALIVNVLWSWPVVVLSFPVLISVGVNAMYSNDYIIAACCYFAGLCILVSKCLSTPEVTSSKNPKLTAAGIVLMGMFLFSMSLLLVRHVRTKNNERPAFLAKASTLVPNGALSLWSLDANTLRSDYFCQVPASVKLYVTNNRQQWTMITNLKIEARDLGNEWRRMGILDVASDPKIYSGQDWKHLLRWRPSDGKYFTLQMIGKNLQPGETISGVLLMSQDLSYDIRGPLRVTILDLQGDRSTIEIDVAKEQTLPGTGFTLDKGEFDMSGMKVEPCPVLWEDWG